jgi:hypothetical protein
MSDILVTRPANANRYGGAMDNSDTVATGSCLCGAVRYRTARPLRDILLCHCEMCRRTHGHIGAYTAVPRAALLLTESRGLKWYRSSDKARRGFCSECGASLFWEPVARDYVAIAAGTLDAPTGLKTSLQIHVASAGDYYAIDSAIPQRAD